MLIFKNEMKKGQFFLRQSFATLIEFLTTLITIAEGSKWQMSNVPMRLRTPREGDAVVFKKAALGSYFIRIAGQNGVKGRRIE